MEREFIYPRTTEVPIPHFVPQHDDFADTLSLNYEEIEPNNVAEYALALVGIKPITPIDTTGMEFVPECGQLNKPEPRDIQFPLFDNVLYLEQYRGKFY